MINGASEKRDEGVELKVERINSMGTRSWDPGNKPAQERPEVDQEQGKAKHEEAESWSARSSVDAHSTQDAVAGLDPKAEPVASVDLLERPVETEHNEEHPFA